MKAPQFKPEQTTEVAVTAQLEAGALTQIPETRNDHGQESGGKFQLWGPNILDTLENKDGRGVMSQAFLRDWDASQQLEGIDKSDAQDAVVKRYPHDMTMLGAQWMSKVQETEVYGFSTPIPKIMAHQSPGATQQAILELTGTTDFAKQEQVPVVRRGGGSQADVANGAWTTYASSVGQEQAERNLLEKIKEIRTREGKGEDDAIISRANRIMGEKLDIKGKNVTLFQALQGESVNPALLPSDLQQFFQATNPQILALPDNKVVAAASVDFHKSESDMMAAERDEGIPVDDKLHQQTGFWDAVFGMGNKSRAEIGRMLARTGLATSGITPEDIPDQMDSAELLKVLFDFELPKGTVFRPDPKEPILPQVFEFMSAYPGEMLKLQKYAGGLLAGEAADPINWIGTAVGGKTAAFLMGRKFVKATEKAKKALEKEDLIEKGLSVEQVNEEFLTNLRNLKELDGDLAKRSEKLLEEDPRFFQKMKKVLPNTTLNDAQIAKLGLEVNDRADTMIKFVKNHGPEVFADPKLAKSFLEEVKNIYGLIAPRLAAKTAGGRSMKSLDSVETQTADDMAQQFWKIMNTMSTPEQMAAHMARFKDSTELAAGLKAIARPGWGKMYNEILINGMLSGPMTLLGLNPLGNTLAFGMHLGQRQMAGLFGKGGVPAGEAARMLTSALGTVPSAMRLFFKTMGKGQGELNTLVKEGEAKVDLTKFATIRGENFPNSPQLMKSAIDWFGAFVRLPSRTMMAQDEAMKAIFYQSELTAQAGRAATQLPGWNKMTGAQKNAHRSMILDDMKVNPHLHMEANKAANFTAHQNTFTSPGGPTLEAMVDLSNSHPALKALFPFIRTPANIVKRINSDFPLAQGVKVFKTLREGSKIEKQEAMGRLSFSSALLGSYAALASNGIVIGGRGPNDPKMRKLQREQLGQDQGALAFDTTGNGEADRYLLLNPRTHVGQLLGIVGDLVEMRGYATDEAPGANENIFATLTGLVADLAGEAPFLEATADLMELLHQGQNGNFEAVEKHLGRMGATYVMPLYVGARGQIRRAIDPTKRDTTPDHGQDNAGVFDDLRAVIDNIKNQTPGFSEDLLPDHNMFGSVQQYPHGVGPGDIEGDPTARLLHAFTPMANMLTMKPAIPEQELEVSRWMFNNDVVVPNPRRTYQGVSIPNNLYQQWKILIGRGDVVDPSTGDVMEAGLLPPVAEDLALVIEVGDTTPVYDRSTGELTTDQITSFKQVYSERVNTARELLLSRPEWSEIHAQMLEREEAALGASLEERTLSTNSGQRHVPGLSLR